MATSDYNLNYTGQPVTLGQLGQNYANPPAQPHPSTSAQGFANLSPFWQNTFQQFSQNPKFASLFGGVSASGPSAQNAPPNPPAISGSQPGADTNATVVPASSVPGGAMGAPTLETPARAPAGGGMFDLWRAQSLPSFGSSGYGRAFNVGGFGGLGTSGGQAAGPGARYWARLNNIGGA